jgi:hypothetical protein
VPEAGVPLPSRLSGVRCQAHGAPDVELEVVEVRGFARHLGEQVTMLIIDPQHPTVDVDATPRLIELPEAHNVGLQPWIEVHSSECAMSTIIAGEDDGASSLDLGDGAIAKLDGATNLGVELSEDVL